MDRLTITQNNKFTKKYLIKKVFSNDLLLSKAKVYLRNQNYLGYEKIKNILEINFNKNFPVSYVLIYKKKIVGFLGVLFSQKYSYNKKYVNCNIHSWVVDKSHRFVSHLLFKDLFKKKCTISVLSSLPRLKMSFEKMGFKILIMNYIIMCNFKFFRHLDKKNLKIITNKHEIKKKLKKKELEIYKNHLQKNYECFIVYCKNFKSSILIVGSITYKKKFFKIFNIIYCSNIKLGRKNVKFITSYIFKNFNSFAIGQYFLKKNECILNNSILSFFFARKKTIFIKNKPKKFEFNNLYSETEY